MTRVGLLAQRRKFVIPNEILSGFNDGSIKYLKIYVCYFFVLFTLFSHVSNIMHAKVTLIVCVSISYIFKDA